MEFHCTYQGYRDITHGNGCYCKGCQGCHRLECVCVFMLPLTALYFVLVNIMGTHICKLSIRLYGALSLSVGMPQ